MNIRISLRLKRWRLAPVAALALWSMSIVAHAQALEASFACSKATRAVDRLICSQATLRWHDLAMSRHYVQATTAARDDAARTALLAGQRDWLRERDRRCIGDRTFKQLSDDANPLAQVARDCLDSVYTTRRRQLQDLASPAIVPRKVRAVDVAPIVRARPELGTVAEFTVAKVQFSPEGKMLALSLPSLELDFPDQVWLYRIDDARLMAATPAPDQQDPHPRGSVSAIQALAWEGDTLYARVSLWGGEGDGEASPMATYAATIDGSKRLDPPPARIVKLLDAAKQRAVKIPDNEIPAEYRDAPEMIEGNQNFLVWPDDRGHGTLLLMMRERRVNMPDYLVAWGSWELSHHIFDAKRSLLLHTGDTGIALFDMPTRTMRRIARTSRGDRPMAISNELRMLAWSSRSPCGDETLALPDEKAPTRLCFAELP